MHPTALYTYTHIQFENKTVTEGSSDKLIFTSEYLQTPIFVYNKNCAEHAKVPHDFSPVEEGLRNIFHKYLLHAGVARCSLFVGFDLLQ